MATFDAVHVCLCELAHCDLLSVEVVMVRRISNGTGPAYVTATVKFTPVLKRFVGKQLDRIDRSGLRGLDIARKLAWPSRP